MKLDPATPPAGSRLANRLGLGLALAHLVLGLALCSAYGPTWDASFGDYAYGERVLESLLHGEALQLGPQHVPQLERAEPHPEFLYNFAWFQLYPLAATLSAAACQVGFTGLGLCSALTAHHLVIVAFVSLLIWGLTRFAVPRIGAGASLAAVAFLMTAPRFFAHGFNNLKDMPETCLWSLAALVGFVGLRAGGRRSWLLFGALSGLALAQKANALFLPGLLALALAAFWLRERSREPLRRAHLGLGAPLALVAFVAVYFAVSPAFWQEPFARLGQHLDATLHAGNTLLVEGAAAPSSVFSWGGLAAFLKTTPPALLLFAALGAVAGRAAPALRLFLVLWVGLVLGRTALPGMRNFDGVRHFLEFYPALALLAGDGLALAASRARRLGPWAAPLLVTAALIPGAAATLGTHPNGICYYNFIGGSLAHQQAAGNLDASDYWGNSYWQGLAWLDDHAERDAMLLVPVAPEIVECAAPVALREDLALWPRGQEEGPPRTLYLMYITRRNWYGPLVRQLAAHDASVVHEVRVQGGVILRIHRLDSAEAIALALESWRRELRSKASIQRLTEWILEAPKERYPPLRDALEGLGRENLEARTQALLEQLPAELHQAGGDFLWHAASGG